jgi:hypothetical protein
MATKRTATKAKKATRKKAAARKASPSAEMKRFERQNDLRTLREADDIRNDPTRMRGAQREAKDQQKSLDRFVK